jgi:hypothetical protein
MEDIAYKNQIKPILHNLTDIDETKMVNGLPSCKKELMKFSIFSKHNSIQECRSYLAKLISKVLIGEFESKNWKQYQDNEENDE